MINETMGKHSAQLESMFKELAPQELENIKDALKIVVKSVRRQDFR